MKYLELSLNKRLLIVESEKILNEIMIQYQNEHNLDVHNDISIKKGLKFICKGSDLTEDIAKGLVENELQTAQMFGQVVFKKYDYKGIDIKLFGWVNNALASFISAIESKGFHWGENPVHLIERGEATEHERVKNQNEWQEAESRTFNPVKCIICEIL